MCALCIEELFDTIFNMVCGAPMAYGSRKSAMAERVKQKKTYWHCVRDLPHDFVQSLYPPFIKMLHKIWTEKPRYAFIVLLMN